VLKENIEITVHLVVSEPAKQIIGIETDYSIPGVEDLGDHL